MASIVMIGGGTLSIGVAACTGAGSTGSTCSYVSDCSGKLECLANTCVPPGGVPVPRDSERTVQEASSLVVLNGPNVTSEPSDLVRFGQVPTEPSQMLYLRFATTALPPGKVNRAFLLLRIANDEPRGPGRVKLALYRLDSDLPSSGVPSRWLRASDAEAWGTPGASVVRFDVTRLVSAEAGRSGSHHWLISATSANGSKISAHTVGGARMGPWLEVYSQ